jgi:1-deoxy-D-xylulose-5-phosphate synthase
MLGEPHALPIGRSELLREGRDVTLLAIGAMVLAAENAADMLAERGISAAVVNARFVKPLDEQLILEWTRRTGALVTIEEGMLAGGFGAAVLELLMREGLRLPVRCLGIPDRIFDHGSQNTLRKHAGLTAHELAGAAAQLVSQPVAVP